jgi:transposase
MRTRLGPKQAIVATAHKIARTVYHLLKTHEPYREETAAEYDRKRRERELKHLARQAQKLGYTLIAVPDRRPEAQPEPIGRRQAPVFTRHRYADREVS